jgi:8-oxo-dGTP pyrophosphatase MutT (NUDIX family)
MRLLRKAGLLLSLFLIEAAYRSRYGVTLCTRAGPMRGVRLVLLRDGCVLLVRHRYAPWAWTLPGGGVRRGETSEQALVRETREETGFRLRAIGGAIGIYVGPMRRDDRIEVFYADDFEAPSAPGGNFEIIARAWFDLDRLPEDLSPASRRRIEAYRRGVRGERGDW